MAKKQTQQQDNSSAGALDVLANFFILPLHMPALTTSSSGYKNILHYVYFKKHESPKEDLKTPKNRTLFVLNIPVDATEDHLRDLFKPCGRVISVQFLNRSRATDSTLTKEEREHQEELERLEKEAALLESEANNKKNTTNNKGKKGKKQQEAESQAEEGVRTLYATGSQAYVVFLEEQELNKALNMKKKRRTWVNTGNDATPADIAKLSSLGVSSMFMFLFSHRDFWGSGLDAGLWC